MTTTKKEKIDRGGGADQARKSKPAKSATKGTKKKVTRGGGK
ncbi:MAG: hypothetical protein ACLGJB_26150 [Blastocatellia bacterium]